MMRVARRIFAEYLVGRGLKAIAEGLTRDDIPSPSAYDRSKWVWSKEPAHQPLINPDDFDRVQALQRAKGSADERSLCRTPRGYALHGIMRCGICERKMQGSWNNGKAHYRCTFLSEYAAKNKVPHPTSTWTALCRRSETPIQRTKRRFTAE
jgi:hypothetical protein